MKKILVLNGPNINMLGVREKNIYGQQDYAALCEYIGQEAAALNVEVEVRQSNFEGELVTLIQQAYGKFDGIVTRSAVSFSGGSRAERLFITRSRVFSS